MPLSPRQQRVFNFIKAYTESNGKSPKLTEIGKEFGYTSPATTHRIVSILVREGLIVRQPRASRGIQIVDNQTNETEGDPKVRCPRCSEDLPLREFGICRARESGRNLYCKGCSRAMVYAGRDRVRQMKEKRKAIIARKPSVVSPMFETVIARVKEAIWAGRCTREEIKEETRLRMDDICDALAMLNGEYGAIRFQRVAGEACFYPVKKVA